MSAGRGLHGSAAERVAAGHLALRNVSKEFAGNRVLRDVSIDIAPGEIRALVGQNGSGKSTLLKVLAGYHQPEPGATATIGGTAFELGSAVAASASGLRFMHQDLGLAPDLSALDNLAMGRGYARRRSGAIAWKDERRRAEETFANLGFEIDVDAPVGALTASQRTAVAIARATEDCKDGKVGVLVLDEPTASLPSAETGRLFDVIRKVNEQGVTIIYVSHRFAEIFELCHSVTVLRDGALIDTRTVADLDIPGLIELTLGREVAMFERAMADEVSDPVTGTPVLQVRGLQGKVLSGVDFDLLPGEVLGVAGVTGSGREELAELLVADHARRGEVATASGPLPLGRPYRCYRQGIALVPADRHAKGLLLGMSLRENVTVSRLRPNYGMTGLSRRSEQRDAAEWLARLQILPPDPEAEIHTLSGGNQQKVVMARALRLQPKVLVLDEPTQGVDVGAKAAIHEVVSSAAASGAGVLVVSSDSEELIAIADRILILIHGSALGPFKTSELTVETLDELVIREDMLVSAAESIP